MTSLRPRTLIPIAALTAIIAGSTAAASFQPATPLERLVAQVADDDAPRTPAQQDLVGFALQRYADHDLELPEVGIEFHPSTLDCGGHQGIYVESTRSLHMCSLSPSTMLHELAHAWANHNLSDERKAEFAAHRDLDAWNDHDHAWEHRATEHAAETIAWALLDRPSTIRFLEESADGSVRPVFRLLTIKDSSAEDLYRGFVELTGMEPRFRTAAEWDSEALEAEWQRYMNSMSSPEANRVTG